jgi:hypothetical protein
MVISVGGSGYLARDLQYSPITITIQDDLFFGKLNIKRLQ